jgi:hypothetical protein
MLLYSLIIKYNYYMKFIHLVFYNLKLNIYYNEKQYIKLKFYNIYI